MDLTPVDIVGKRCYHFIHAEDVEGIRHSHLDCKYLPCVGTSGLVCLFLMPLWFQRQFLPSVSCVHLRGLSASGEKKVSHKSLQLVLGLDGKLDLGPGKIAGSLGARPGLCGLLRFLSHEVMAGRSP